VTEHIDRAVAELKRAIDNNPGATIILGHSMYEGDIRDVIKDMVFEED
jgi:hypothetical protein